MEKFDLFDIDRKNLGLKQDRDSLVTMPSQTYRQVVHVVIFNSEGKMLIQQRQVNKNPYPNMWDVSCGGSVQSGENSRQGATRELFEELSISYDFTNTRPALTINFNQGFDDFYIINLDINDLKTLSIQNSEVQSVKWASKEDIIKLNNMSMFVPYYESFISFLFELRLHHYGSHRVN